MHQRTKLTGQIAIPKCEDAGIYIQRDTPKICLTRQEVGGIINWYERVNSNFDEQLEARHGFACEWGNSWRATVLGEPLCFCGLYLQEPY